MSTNVKWALVIGFAIVTATIVYAITRDAVWSIIGLLGAFSAGRAVVHPGSAG